MFPLFVVFLINGVVTAPNPEPQENHNVKLASSYSSRIDYPTKSVTVIANSGVKRAVAEAGLKNYGSYGAAFNPGFSPGSGNPVRSNLGLNTFQPGYGGNVEQQIIPGNPPRLYPEQNPLQQGFQGIIASNSPNFFKETPATIHGGRNTITPYHRTQVIPGNPSKFYTGTNPVGYGGFSGNYQQQIVPRNPSLGGYKIGTGFGLGKGYGLNNLRDRYDSFNSGLGNGYNNNFNQINTRFGKFGSRLGVGSGIGGNLGEYGPGLGGLRPALGSGYSGGFASISDLGGFGPGVGHNGYNIGTGFGLGKGYGLRSGVGKIGYGSRHGLSNGVGGYGFNDGIGGYGFNDGIGGYGLNNGIGGFGLKSGIGGYGLNNEIGGYNIDTGFGLGKGYGLRGGFRTSTGGIGDNSSV